MKKISENRLRQIINEELGLEIQKQEDSKIAKENLDKIFSILQYAENTHDGQEQNLNELVGLLGRGALAGAGLAGLLGMNADDVMKGAGDILSGDQEFNLTDGMKDWVYREIISRALSVTSMDEELNNVITAALMVVVSRPNGPAEIQDFFFNPTCDKFVEFTWEALIQYLALKLADPISTFASSVGSAVPFVKTAFTDKGGFGAQAMMGGIGAQTLKLYLLNNPDAAYWMDENIKRPLCIMFDQIDFDMKSLTGGMLNGLISFAS